MSVPFIKEVAEGAIEVLTNRGLVADGRQAVTTALERRFRKQHPILIGEHLDYAELVISDALKAAAKVKAGSISRTDALRQLQHGYNAFSNQSIERALSYGLDLAGDTSAP
jgi:hypothetical protein